MFKSVAAALATAGLALPAAAQRSDDCLGNG